MGITVVNGLATRPSILRVACDAPRCSFVHAFVGTRFLSNCLAAFKGGWVETASGKFLCSKCKGALTWA